MADFEYVACPKCLEKFMAGEEFFRLPQAYCHCPYCGNEFPVGTGMEVVQWHCERRVLLNGHRRRLPLTYADPATPNLVPNHSDSLGRPGGPGRGSQPAGGSPQPP